MEAIVIMALVLVEVALWQWRVAITLRHNVLGGALLGFIGAIVQITAISRVVQDMGNIAKVAGYACGVAIGVLLGCVIDRRLSAAQASVRVFAAADPEPRPRCADAAGPSPSPAGTGTTARSRSCCSRSTSVGPPSWSGSSTRSLRKPAGRSSGSRPVAACSRRCRLDG